MENEPFCCANETELCTSCVLAKYNKELKRFIKKRITNKYDAEDVLQDIVVKVHNSIDRVTDTSRIQAWLFRIAHNTIVDYYRKNNHPTMEFSEDIEDVYDENLSANDEVMSCLKSTINKLPEKQKQVIFLAEFQNMPQKELSKKLGLSISGTKSRVQRARRKIKELMVSNCGLEINGRNFVINNPCKNGC